MQVASCCTLVNHADHHWPFVTHNTSPSKKWSEAALDKLCKTLMAESRDTVLLHSVSDEHKAWTHNNNNPCTMKPMPVTQKGTQWISLKNIAINSLDLSIPTYPGQWVDVVQRTDSFQIRYRTRATWWLPEFDLKMPQIEMNCQSH